jgi:ssDNA-binding Zn-finger/Zn-ribbon topoisomerase 1
MKKILVCFLSYWLLSVSPVLAGEKIAIACSNPGCHYTRTLALGGARLSPGITCYCAQCRDFVRLKLQNWDQYHGQNYPCPTCGRAARPIYSQEEIATLPCPRCGQMTLTAKTLLRFD